MSKKNRRVIINKIVDLYFDLRDPSDTGNTLRDLEGSEMVTGKFLEWLCNGEDDELKEEAMFRKFNEYMSKKERVPMAEVVME